MTDVYAPNEPPRAHVRIVFLGPVSPHWDVVGDYGDRTLVEEFRSRALAASCCFRTTIPSSSATVSASCVTPNAKTSLSSGIWASTKKPSDFSMNSR